MTSPTFNEQELRKLINEAQSLCIEEGENIAKGVIELLTKQDETIWKLREALENIKNRECNCYCDCCSGIDRGLAEDVLSETDVPAGGKE